MSSWLPIKSTSSPPAVAACSRRSQSMRSTGREAFPRSSTSPTCTTVIVPPVHRPEASAAPQRAKAASAC
eukprot:scaffold320005_cov33-Tisochrysis_lutea.AAC.2